MAKRACLTVEEVIDYCDDSDEDYDDYRDDLDEPIMDGGDDEFTDLEGNDLDDEDEDNTNSRPDPSLTANLPGSPGSPCSPGSPGSATWTTTIKRVPIQPFTSPTCPIEDISSVPIGVYDLFFTPYLMEEIVKQSNTYTKAVMGPEKYDKWTKITVDKFKAFLGFSILMGINHLLSLNDYWSKDPCLRYAPIADCISRDRFHEVSRYLHFVDNDTLVYTLLRGGP